jgi:glycyl-tRNA synthetase alpha subunit
LQFANKTPANDRLPRNPQKIEWSEKDKRASEYDRHVFLRKLVEHSWYNFSIKDNWVVFEKLRSLSPAPERKITDLCVALPDM